MTTAARPHANTQAQARYNAYLDTPRWKALRWLRRRLDGGRCRVCCGGRQLQTHHRSYRHRGERGPLGFLAELRDCITLCDACHGRSHRK